MAMRARAATRNLAHLHPTTTVNPPGGGDLVCNSSTLLNALQSATTPPKRAGPSSSFMHLACTPLVKIEPIELLSLLYSTISLVKIE